MGHIPNSRPWLSLWCPSVRNPPQGLGVLICRDAVQPQRASAWQDAKEICTTRMPLNLESLITQDFTHWKLFRSIIYEFTCHNMSPFVSINLLHFKILYDWFFSIFTYYWSKAESIKALGWICYQSRLKANLEVLKQQTHAHLTSAWPGRRN